MKKFSDEQLVKIYQDPQGAQKQEAFDCLYDRYAVSMRRYFYHALNRDADKAKDFVHDLFLKIIEVPRNFDDQLHFKSWLYAVANNMCKNEYRHQEVAAKYVEHVKMHTSEIDETIQDDTHLHLSLQQLEEEKRNLILLRFNQELSIKEIAEILNCKEGTVKSRLFYAIKELTKIHKEVSL